MNRFILFLSILCLVSTAGYGQTLSLGKGNTSTYAVVVGISNYRDESIPDLKFANKDAEAFIAYLQSNAGGNLQEEQMTILLNEEATTSRMAAAMDWLIEKVKEGDQAIIYFSGHGDVETKTSMQHGFLLTHDSPPTTYIAGAYPLFYLQSVITTLSLEKKATVLMIMDACHAGKLAGSAIGGSGATSSVLAKQFANEVKIMSCQPDEFSLEGVQWGGGRGVFSYHLIDGLKGLADKNEDYKVSLLEIERYLEDKVTEEVAPDSQIPMSVGNKSLVISYVDEEILNDLRAEKDLESNVFAMVETRGLEADLLSQVDTSIQQQYQMFIEAIERGQLLDMWSQKSSESKDQKSADSLYKDLVNHHSLKPLFNTMKRRLMVALQEDAQLRLNDYLSIRKGQITSDGFNIKKEIEENHRYAVYLERCADLLGKDHYMYKDVKSKQLYFAALADYDHASINLDRRDSLLQSSLEKLMKGLKYQDMAPHIHAEISKIYSGLNNYELAVEYALKANELSPQWPIPMVLLAGDFKNKGDYELAIKYATKALELQPEFEDAFSILVNAQYMKEAYSEIIDLCQKTIKKYPNYLIAYLELGMAQLTIDQPKEAEESLLQAMRIAPENALVYAYLGEVYAETLQTDKARIALEKSIMLDSYDPYPYSVLAHIYIQEGDLELAKETLQNALSAMPDTYITMGQLGLLYLQNKDFESAWPLFTKAQKLAKEDPLVMFNFFCYYFSKGEEKEAFEWLDSAFAHGLIQYIHNQELLLTDCFQRVILTEKYEGVLQKYNSK